LLHEAVTSYGVDRERNREAHRRFQAMKAEAQKFDVSGEEAVTQRTLMALADLFNPTSASRH
jgi:hypothetical protein